MTNNPTTQLLEEGAAAMQFAQRYAEILGDVVLDVRPVVDVGP